MASKSVTSDRAANTFKVVPCVTINTGANGAA
jgi:hypothetical protein